MDPEKRSIANAIQIEFNDGSKTEKVEIEYPIGHKRRRAEGFAAVEAKLSKNLSGAYDASKTSSLMSLFLDGEEFEKTSVVTFMEKLVGSE